MFLKLKRCVLTFGDIKDVCPKPVYIKREAVDRVETYKYLGMVFDSKLKWKENFNFVLKKVNLRMYCLRKLISFRVNFDMLITFHNAVMYSLNMFGAGCWGGNISKFDRGMLKKIVKKKKKAGNIVEKPLDSFWTLYEKKTVKKMNTNIK